MPAIQAPPLRTADHLTTSEEERFHATGVVRLGRVLDDAELGALRARIDAIMLGEVRYDGMMMQLDAETGRYEDMPAQTPGFKGPTLAYRKIEQLELDPLFRRYLQRPLIRSIAERLIGPEVAIYRSMFMNKPAGKGTVLPWHQDGGLIWRLTGQPLLTLWLALDPATRENGCVRVVPGSHRLGLLSAYGHTITPGQEREHCPPERCEELLLEPGELVLLHNLVLHASGTNASGVPRRAFSVCLMDAALRSTEPGHPGFPVLFGRDALPAI
jgi:phytanoyl-CoA hydroxylase